jgi:hypothetical protein
MRLRRWPPSLPGLSLAKGLRSGPRRIQVFRLVLDIDRLVGQTEGLVVAWLHRIERPVLVGLPGLFALVHGSSAHRCP